MKLPKQRKQTGIPLQWSLYAMIVACWVLPLTLTVLLFNSKLEENVRTRMESTVQASVDNAATVLRERLEEAMSDSRASSYHSIIREAYDKYVLNGDRVALYGASNRYLQGQYSYNSLFDATLLIFADAPELPVFVSSRALQEKFRASAQMRVLSAELAPQALANLDTGIEFRLVDGQLYMLRNLVTPAFVPYAVLIIRLNMEYLLESAANIVWVRDAAVELDGIRMTVAGEDPGSLPLQTRFDPETLSFSVGQRVGVQDHSATLSAVVAGDLLALQLSHDAVRRGAGIRPTFRADCHLFLQPHLQTCRGAHGRHGPLGAGRAGLSHRVFSRQPRVQAVDDPVQHPFRPTERVI